MAVVIKTVQIRRRAKIQKDPHAFFSSECSDPGTQSPRLRLSRARERKSGAVEDKAKLTGAESKNKQGPKKPPTRPKENIKAQKRTAASKTKPPNPNKPKKKTEEPNHREENSDIHAPAAFVNWFQAKQGQRRH